MPQLLSPEHPLVPYIEAMERLKPTEEAKNGVDEMWLLLKLNLQREKIDQRLFIELRSRLWSLRERICEALLPPAQRERRSGL
jgi:hypothetical protein